MSGIKDVAKLAGVSISTVSNVLNGTKTVSPELTERVKRAAAELDYQADPIARSMKNSNSGVIGVVTEDICGMFYPYIIRGISSVAQSRGYQLMICDAQSAYGTAPLQLEEQFFEKMIANRVDGIIFASTVSDLEQKDYFKRIIKKANQYKPTPLVSLERNFVEDGIDSVWVDGYENAKTAVNHLLACGCKKIAHITGPSNLQIAKERLWGYIDSLKAAEINIDYENMIVPGNYSHQSGYLGMKTLLDKYPDLDGVFCGNDQMAIGAMKYLHEAGKKMPEDVRLMGYDDVFVASIMSPPLSSIHISKRQAGIEAANLLFQRIDAGEGAGCAHPRQIKVESKLVVRRSTVADASEDWLLGDW